MAQATSNVLAHDTTPRDEEKYFRRLVGLFHKPVPKIRRTEVAEFLEQAWVDGQLEASARLLLLARPDLNDEIKKVCSELEQTFD